MENFNPVTHDMPSDPQNPASMAPVIFESGGSKILGTMFIASGAEPHPVIILLHGFPGNEVNYDLAHAFRRQGFNVLVFHYRGCWGSEGNYSWQNLIDDTSEAINFIKSDYACEKFRIDKSNIILIGHSMGGFAALYNSILHDEIKNVVSIAGFNSGAFGEILAVNKMIYDYSVQTIQPAVPFVKVESAEKLMDEYIVHKTEWNLLNHIGKLSQKNILMIASKYDTIAPIDIHHNPLADKLRSEMEKEKSKMENGKWKTGNGKWETENGKWEMEENILETGHSFSDKRIELAKIISEWLNNII